MKFINRKKELQVLENEYKSETASLVVVYGRRRVGKTRLIREFAKDKKALLFMATEESEKENRKSFKGLVADYIGSDLLREIDDLSWVGLFKEIVAKVSNEKIVIVMDEFQYIGKSNKAFPSIFQKIWDEILMHENVMVILCGSIISLMKGQTLEYSSPLYGRRTAQINVKQISYLHYGAFYQEGEQGNLIEKYALTGGVPKYIETLLKFEGYEDKICEIVTNESSYLYEEPYFLLSKEVPEVGTYFSILRTIAAGNVKPRDIASVLETKIPNLVHYFKVLLDMDLIKREVPITEKNPQKSKKVIYSISDNYLRFWFKYIYPNRNFIEMDNRDFVIERVLNNYVEGHVSFVYEQIAQEYVLANWYKDHHVIYEKIGKWWDKHEEIDLVAVNETDDRIMFGECKYKKSKVGIPVYNQLRKKSHLVKWGSANRCEVFVLFSKSGFTDELIELAEKDKQLYLIVL